MTRPNAQVPVLIVGGGYAGLSASLFLSATARYRILWVSFRSGGMPSSATSRPSWRT
jgi:protoporphyrinogen oxidase